MSGQVTRHGDDNSPSRPTSCLAVMQRSNWRARRPSSLREVGLQIVITDFPRTSGAPTVLLVGGGVVGHHRRRGGAARLRNGAGIPGSSGSRMPHGTGPGRGKARRAGAPGASAAGLLGPQGSPVPTDGTRARQRKPRGQRAETPAIVPLTVKKASREGRLLLRPRAGALALQRYLAWCPCPPRPAAR